MKYHKFLFALQIVLALYACDSSKNDTIDIEATSAVKKAIVGLPKTLSKQHHEVMVLGTFHFDRKNDGSDVVGKHSMDIRSKSNQKILDSLTDKIVREYQPTIVAIELRPSSQKYIDSLYNAYRNGVYELGINEVFQVGFRVAKKMNLDKVHCIDNRPPQPETVDSVDDWDAYAQEMSHEAIWHEYDSINMLHNTYMDELMNKISLVDYLTVANSSELSKRNKQFWVTGLVNLGVGDTYIGADLTGNWYRRNTRIFTNVRNLCKSKNEKIFMIYGYGHKWILEELFSASPEFTTKQLF